MIITLDDHRPTSWNKYYSGLHWWERKSLTDEVHSLVVATLGPEFETFDVPVDIVVTAYFKSHPQDPDNICTKMYIDGLVGRVIHNDTMEYVASVTSRSRKAKENRVEIEVQQSSGRP